MSLFGYLKRFVTKATLRSCKGRGRGFVVQLKTAYQRVVISSFCGGYDVNNALFYAFVFH